MKKKEARRVLDEASNALDNSHVITGDSKRAAALKRRAEDMVEGAMLGLAAAEVLLEDDGPDMRAGDVVDAVMAYVAKVLGARDCGVKTEEETETETKEEDGGDDDER